MLIISIPIIAQSLNGTQMQLIICIYVFIHHLCSRIMSSKLIKQSETETFCLNECKAGEASSLCSF